MKTLDETVCNLVCGICDEYITREERQDMANALERIIRLAVEQRNDYIRKYYERFDCYRHEAFQNRDDAALLAAAKEGKP